MPILNPDHLVEQARILAGAGRKGQRGPPRQVDLRRAVSSAYYAVFHALLTAAGDCFVGALHRGTPRYALVYRAINHGAARALCLEASRMRPSDKFRPFMPAAEFSHDLRSFALHFVRLQEERHGADYDPLPRLATAEVLASIGRAESALRMFRGVAVVERDLFLTLLAFPPR